jgi:hypothetical protein
MSHLGGRGFCARPWIGIVSVGVRTSGTAPSGRSLITFGVYGRIIKIAIVLQRTRSPDMTYSMSHAASATAAIFLEGKTVRTEWSA